MGITCQPWLVLRSFSHKSILHINFIQEKHGVEFNIESLKKGNAGIQNF